MLSDNFAMLAGDFFRSSRIILFDGVKASDSGLYECVAEGFRTLSVKHQLQVEVGCNATIRKDVRKCY